MKIRMSLSPKLFFVALAATGAAATGCGQLDGGNSATEGALVATISGTVSDGQNRPLSGVRVVLSGTTSATATTAAAGTYSFSLNIPGATGSWSVQPSRTGCTFNPTVANLNGVNGNRVQNFTGSGTNCVGVVQQPAAVDPGPRGGAAAAGGPLATLNTAEVATFTAALEVFKEIDSVSGGIAGEDGRGLGPTFNSNSCAGCHAQPNVGGSSPGQTSPQNPIPNPQLALATLDGAANTVPSFITAGGPVREARFPIALGGGVAGLFTIRGRSDAGGCTLAQPNFAAQVASGDIIFRIPTPVFGLGLVEATPDASLQASFTATAARRQALGIAGRFNTSGNDGTITRFGWKAQNKSLAIFAGEAYNVEQGVSNENFTNERAAVAGCVFNGSPEDHTNNGALATGTDVEMASDVVSFALFMRLAAAPAPDAPTTSTTNGANLFNTVGCAACHSPSLTTGPSPITGVSNINYAPFSDFAIHHMGSGLADNVGQGAAGADEFRTAPLWGVGQRLFFMHDGRTANIVQAISAHSGTGSEANTVVSNFVALSTAQQQDLVNFLRSL